MSEKELNEQYIKNKIQGICQDCMWFDKTIPIINKMLSEAYISGFEQGKFDLKMDLQQKVEQQEKEIDRLNNIINELEKYIVEEIDDAQEELNIILQGNDLDYKNECTKEFNCIKNALDMLLDKLKELKEE